MSFVRIVVVAVAMTVGARQSTAQQMPAPHLSRVRSVDVRADSSNTRPRLNYELDEPSRSAQAKRAAWAGAVLGAIGGVAAGIAASNQTGCDVTTNSSCSPIRTQASITLFYTATGIALGAATGAILGAIWPIKGEAGSRSQVAATR
jgi:hypothetical protein